MAENNHSTWNGWFPVDHQIDGKLPTDLEEGTRVLVWVPAMSGDWPGEAHIAWVEAGRLVGEWRFIDEAPGVNEGLNDTDPTHWMLLPGEPRGLAEAA